MAIGTKRGQMMQFSSSYPPEMLERLERLHLTTRIEIQEYMREALGDLLEKYAHVLESPKPTGMKHGSKKK